MTYWYVKAKYPTLTSRISQLVSFITEDPKHVTLSFNVIFFLSHLLSNRISGRVSAPSDKSLVVWFKRLLNRERSNVTWGKWVGFEFYCAWPLLGSIGGDGINSWMPSWEAETITLAVMCGEWDNLVSSRATAPHRSEHMGRMRMEPPGCCADVLKEVERERKSKGAGENRENWSIWCFNHCGCPPAGFKLWQHFHSSF